MRDQQAARVNGEPAAIGIDGDHRIVLWNRATERLLGIPASEVMGRRCHEVLEGRDAFNNRFCHATCSPLVMLARGEAVSGFEIGVTSGRGAARKLRVSTLRLLAQRHAGDPAGRPGVLHVIEPLDDASAGASEAAPLTRREREVLVLVASGLQNKEVAAKLGLSLATVRNHVHNILEKLGLHSKLEAVALAFRNGWVESAGNEPASPERVPAVSGSRPGFTGSYGR
jgi:DNA-binding CsgD family transcriptional regulator